MDKKTIDRIVWWIPFRGLRDAIRDSLTKPKSTIHIENNIDYVIPAEYIKCNICGKDSRLIFNSTILNKYDVKYYFCENCEHLQTETPYWIEESYSDALSITDTGIIQRNLYMADVISKIIIRFFDVKGKFLEYAGGYGILTRMMRDMGFDFYWTDKYANNIFAKGFEYDGQSKIELLLAIEIFEHLASPLEEIQKMFQLSDNIIFSQTLLPLPVPKIDDWWYYSNISGQHISFYTKKTLQYIAKKFNKNYVCYGDLHLFTSKKIDEHDLKLAAGSTMKNTSGLKSRTGDDMIFCRKLLESKK